MKPNVQVRSALPAVDDLADACSATRRLGKISKPVSPGAVPLPVSACPGGPGPRADIGPMPAALGAITRAIGRIAFVTRTRDARPRPPAFRASAWAPQLVLEVRQVPR
ncbi:MAG: hypothetical protein KGI90_15305 [Burkholderiales bacterium]|nr:hypothetical protein [Burkholderiales bacterium]MDE2276918.1 hypothetical protein [Burkholderiales bacterium]